MDFSQQGYDIRFEWGLAGVKALAALSDVVIIGCAFFLDLRGCGG